MAFASHVVCRTGEEGRDVVCRTGGREGALCVGLGRRGLGERRKGRDEAVLVHFMG